MNTTKVNKWGNSQGVILPKHLCEHVGIQVGDTLEVTVDATSGTIELSLAPHTKTGTQRILSQEP